MKRLLLLIMALMGLFLSASSSVAALMPRGQALTWLYYTLQTTDTEAYFLYRMELESRHTEKLFDLSALSSIRFISSLSQQDGFLFLGQKAGFYSIYHVQNDGRITQTPPIALPLTGDYRLSYLGEWLIIFDHYEELYRLRLDGTGFQKITSQPINSSGIPTFITSTDAQTLYWLDTSDDAHLLLWRFSLDDETIRSLPLDFDDATLSAAIGDDVYIQANYKDTTTGLYHVSFDSGQITLLTPSDENYFFMALSPNQQNIYTYQMFFDSDYTIFYEIPLTPPHIPKQIFGERGLFHFNAFTFSPDGRWLLMVLGIDDAESYLYRWDIQRGIIDKKISSPGFHQWLDTSKLLILSAEGMFAVMDMTESETIAVQDIYPASSRYNFRHIGLVNDWIIYSTRHSLPISEDDNDYLYRFNIKTYTNEGLLSNGQIGYTFIETVSPPTPYTVPPTAGLATLATTLILTYIFTRAGGLKSA